jgi:hypothetical protein
VRGLVLAGLGGLSLAIGAASAIAAPANSGSVCKSYERAASRALASNDTAEIARLRGAIPQACSAALARLSAPSRRAADIQAPQKPHRDAAARQAPPPRTIAPPPPQPAPPPQLSAAQIRKDWFDANSVGRIDLVQSMLDRGLVLIGTTIDDQQNTALHLASERCNAALITFLLGRGARTDLPNVWRDTPPRIALVRCGAGSAAVAALQGH